MEIPAPKTSQPFVHEPLNVDVDAIAGHYTFTKEVRLPWEGRELLYLVGYAIIDTSCCGVGGCGYALVPGFVQSWHSGTDDRGLPISQVEPIRDAAVRRGMERHIEREEHVPQVQFL